jgi:hypothetical protein
MDPSRPQARKNSISRTEEYGEHGNGKVNGHGMLAPGSPNETSPLLGIREHEESPASYAEHTDWRKELRVLTAYTLPVLGYVTSILLAALR